MTVLHHCKQPIHTPDHFTPMPLAQRGKLQAPIKDGLVPRMVATIRSLGPQQATLPIRGTCSLALARPRRIGLSMQQAKHPTCQSFAVTRARMARSLGWRDLVESLSCFAQAAAGQAVIDPFDQTRSARTLRLPVESPTATDVMRRAHTLSDRAPKTDLGTLPHEKDQAPRHRNTPPPIAPSNNTSNAAPSGPPSGICTCRPSTTSCTVVRSLLLTGSPVKALAVA